MIKVFISQPMNGLSDEEILDNRNEAVEKLEQLYPDVEIEIIDSFFEKAPHTASPLWFLGKSIQLLADADIVYFVEGWQDARGCSIEHICAVEYGLKVLEPTDIDIPEPEPDEDETNEVEPDEDESETAEDEDEIETETDKDEVDDTDEIDDEAE